MIATEKDDPEVLELLTEKKSNLLNVARKKNDRTALMFASENKRYY